MTWKPMKFHQLHGKHIRLSEDCTIAKVQSGPICDGLCFTNRPLAPAEKLTIVMNGTFGAVGIGVIENDPNTLERSLPVRLPKGYDKTLGLWGIVSNNAWLSVADDNGTAVSIYLEEITSKIIIARHGHEPKELIADFIPDDPIHVIFDLYGDTSLKITSEIAFQPRMELLSLDAASHHIKSEYFGNFGVLEAARFAPPVTAKVELRRNVAVSHDPSPSRGNFAFVETPLKSDSALVVELTVLKQRKPVRMLLTTKDARRVYSCESFSKLCETTYSLMMESEVTEALCELAVRISPRGSVYISLNNRGWIKRMQVDADLEYHVVFAMEHIVVLTLLGMTSGMGEVGDDLIVTPEEAPQKPQGVELPECVVCLVSPRDVAVRPCSHVAMCEGCALSLHRSDGPSCPVCRAGITEVFKLYFP